MLCFDRIDFSKGIDVNKTSESKECDICHYWYFLNKGLKFQPDVCNGSHDLLMISMSLSDNALLKIEGAENRCIIIGINKSEATNAMQNINLTKKVEYYKTYIFIIAFKNK